MKKLWFSSRKFFDFNSFPSVSILIFVFLISTTRGGPLTHHPPETDLEVGNNSLVAPAGPPHPVGCRYQGSLFAPGEDVVTEEPCLVCQCKSAVVCKLRICPETPDPPPPGCIVVHKAKKCCAQLVCNQNLLGHETNRKLSREQKLPAVNSSLSTTLAAAGAEGKGFCVVDGTVYAEGSAMRSSSLCQYCFCIRGEMKCSKPQCVIPMNGCKPRFRSYACCPTNYDCQDSNSTAVVKTTPTSTPIPHFLKGCLVNGKKIAEGEPVLPLQLENHTNPCQTCFCMGGVIHCRQLECDRPIEGCKPITEHGHCCPDRYDCSNLNKLSKSKSHQILSANLIKAPTNSVESTSTTSQEPSTTTSSTTVSSTTIETASTTTTTIAPSTTTTSATTTTATAATTTTTPTPTPTTTTTTTATMPTTTTTTTTAAAATTTTTTPKTSPINTTEKAEILPVPASMKMTTAENPSVLIAASGERKLNANSRPRNKSDAGSREDRQNKDRNHFRYRTSYEDDEKEDSASLSYENTERDNIDPNSSLSYEETTDHSGSNSDSEMDNDNAEIAPTEENSVEIEVEGRNDSMESEGKTSLPLQSEVGDEETPNQKLLASTGTNTNALTDSDSDPDTDANTEKENDTEPKEINVKKLRTKNPTGSPSLTDFLTSTTATTTTTTTVATSVNPSSTPNPTTVVVSNMSEGVSLAGGDSLKEVEATNTSSLSSFSGLSQDSGSGSGSGSDSDAEITGSSIINQDVENTEVTSSASPTTTETATTTTATSSVIFTNATTTTTAPPTTSTTTTSTTTSTTAAPSTSTNPSPSVQGQGQQPQPTSETTVKNVHFISFGVEDAVVSPLNETAPHFESQLTYDNNALKISLIPPTPPKGYPKRIHSSHHHNSSKGPSSHTDTSSPHSSQGGGEAVNSIIQSGAGSGPGRKDELGNAIMDVPVSTSLYNNGFYRSGGMIITDDSQRGSIELEISSNRPFPGQVFDDGDHSQGIQKQHGMASPPPPPAPVPGPAPVPVPAKVPAPAPVSVPVPASAPESQSNSHKKAHFDSPPLPLLLTSIKPPYPSSPLPTLSDNNPARTYSKFGIQDSTYYRYGYGNGNGNNNGNPPPPTRANANMNPHNSPIPNQHHQYHHRYYNAPEHEHFVPQNPYAGFEQVINQDQDQEDVTYEEVDDDDVGEGVSFEEQEQSMEVQNQNPEIENLGNNQFNYQKKPGTVSTLRPLPTFVFPQNPLEETSTPIYNSSTKIQIQIPPKSHSQQQNPNQNQYTQQNPIASGTKKVPGYNYNYNYNKHQQQLQLPQQPQKPQQQGHGQGSVGFKPAVSFPFALPKKPAGLEFNLGLKLSGCNIYGKMYNVEDVILELSSSCVRCLCTEMGVQCSEILC